MRAKASVFSGALVDPLGLGLEGRRPARVIGDHLKQPSRHPRTLCTCLTGGVY